jgi:hypothetical protein
VDRTCVDAEHAVVEGGAGRVVGTVLAGEVRAASVVVAHA